MEYIRKIRPIHLGFVILSIAILGIFGIKEIPKTTLWDRMMTLSSPQLDGSLLRRASYITVAIEAFKANPMLGCGFGSFPLIYERSIQSTAFALKDEQSNKRMAHNTFLEILVGTGIIGLTFFIFLLFMSFSFFYVAQLRIKRRDRLGGAYIRCLGYSFISLLASFLFLSAPYHKYMWLFIGLSAVAYNLTKAKGSINPAIKQNN